MKRIPVLLIVVFFCKHSNAQLSGQASSAATQNTITQDSTLQFTFEAAEKANEQYFIKKINPTIDKKELYDSLYDCLTKYIKSIDGLNETQRGDARSKLRKLRTEFEEAGIYYSSNGDNKIAAKYLECYINIPRLPIFSGEQFANNSNYPAYVFNVAAEMHNARDYENAVLYLQEYIELGEKRYQQTCYKFLANDLDILNRFDDEANTLDEGIMNYPNDIEMLKQAIVLNTQRNKKEKAQELLNKALSIAPNDTGLLLFKASTDDQNGRYAEALPIFKSFHEQMPNDLQLTKQLAFCYYNLAGTLVSESNLAKDPERFKTLRNEADEYYKQTIILLEPLSKDAEVVMNDQRITYALSDALTQVGRSNDASRVQQFAQNSINQSSNSGSKSTKGIPNFNEWFKPKLNKILEEWEQRGEFEPAKDYMKRVNPETRKALIVKTRNSYEQQFISEYSVDYNLEELTLKPYDPDHETFRIQTRQGDLYIRVPNSNNEAGKFKDSWNQIKVYAPQFKVDKSGQLRLMAAQFVTPYGKNYNYNANESLVYNRIKIARPEWNDDTDDLFADNGKENTYSNSKSSNNKTNEEELLNVGESSVDVNVPRNKDKNDNTFVLIIANENYKNVEYVPFALNDGKSFRRYCRDVLGVQEEHIIHVENGTGNEMKAAIDRIKDYELAYDNIKLLVYYSGHGVPDLSTGESYLLPTDASPHNISTAYKLNRFYSELAENKPQSVTVFLDACFSGAKKDGQIMDKSARGVIVTPREETPTTNMVVFSACSGSQTAYPYMNQKHGLFTYFLLKKLQEDKGKTTYKRLSEYINTNVKQNSIRLNGKIQTPTITSALPETEWSNWRLDK